MKSIRLIELYSKIIFSKASLEKSLDKIIEDMKLISAVVESKPSIFRFLKAPIYSPDEKIKFLSVLEKGAGLAKLTMDCMEAILKNNRSEYISDIYNQLVNMKIKANGMTKAVLTTAHKMSKEDIEHCQAILEQKLTKRFVIEHNIDPSIISGAVLEYDNIMYDVSVATAMHKIQQLMLASEY